MSAPEQKDATGVPRSCWPARQQYSFALPGNQQNAMSTHNEQGRGQRVQWHYQVHASPYSTPRLHFELVLSMFTASCMPLACAEDIQDGAEEGVLRLGDGGRERGGPGEPGTPPAGRGRRGRGPGGQPGRGRRVPRPSLRGPWRGARCRGRRATPWEQGPALRCTAENRQSQALTLRRHTLTERCCRPETLDGQRCLGHRAQRTRSVHTSTVLYSILRAASYPLYCTVSYLCQENLQHFQDGGRQRWLQGVAPSHGGGRGRRRHPRTRPRRGRRGRGWGAPGARRRGVSTAWGVARDMLPPGCAARPPPPCRPRDALPQVRRWPAPAPLGPAPSPHLRCARETAVYQGVSRVPGRQWCTRETVVYQGDSGVPGRQWCTRETVVYQGDSGVPGRQWCTRETVVYQEDSGVPGRQWQERKMGACACFCALPPGHRRRTNAEGGR